MTHQITTYNNSGKRFLPSGIYPEFNRRKEWMGKVREVRMGLLFLLMMVMGVGSAWAEVCNGGIEKLNPIVLSPLRYESGKPSVRQASGTMGLNRCKGRYLFRNLQMK